MEFVKYPSLTNSYKQDFIDYCVNFGFDKECTWYVTEKVHGANFAFYVNPVLEEVRCAKRTSFLTKLEDFYNAGYVKGKYQESAISLGKHFGRPTVIYGELCGGYYDGKSTGMKVQKEVQYCPHNEFIVFDIVVDNEMLSPEEIQMLCWEHGLIPAPLIFQGSLQDALAVPNSYTSLVGPKYFGLPELEDNIAEGTVIKPWPIVRDIRGNLIMFRNKNDRFSEKKHTPKVVPTEMTGDLLRIYNTMLNYVTENKLNAVISKVGKEPKFFPKIRGLFLQDILEDSGITEEWHGLEKAQNKRILSELDNIMLPLIRRGLGIGQ